MKKFSKKEKILLVSAIVAVGGVFLSQRDSHAPAKPSRNLAGQIQIKKRMIAEALDLAKNKEEILKEAGLYTQYARPSSKDSTPLLLKEMESLAGASQVQLKDVKSVLPNKADDDMKNVVELEVEGSLVQFVSFLHSIQASKSLLQVERFRVNPTTDRPDLLKAHLTVSMLAF